MKLGNVEFSSSITGCLSLMLSVHARVDSGQCAVRSIDAVEGSSGSTSSSDGAATPSASWLIKDYGTTPKREADNNRDPCAREAGMRKPESRRRGPWCGHAGCDAKHADIGWSALLQSAVTRWSYGFTGNWYKLSRVILLVSPGGLHAPLTHYLTYRLTASRAHPRVVA